jgi:signal transduction histidine kinase
MAQPDLATEADVEAEAPEAADVETRRLKAQYAEIAQVAGGLAHEIRNPLSTMRMNLDLLAEDFRGAESVRERRVLQKIERVRSESLRLEAILEDFLRFARVKEPDRRRVDLHAIVDDLCDFFEPQAAAHGIVLRRQLAPEPAWALLDVELFRQALFNLICNAQNAMPDGGELILTARPDGDGWHRVEILDTGCGIPPETLPRIFDPFFSTRPGGSGLGLPTVRKIVEAHGGTIGVESEPGKGSRFAVRLPAASAAVGG